MPKISVIIPVYNGAGYIRKALDSILCLELIDFEIIVIDDGSTDMSSAIIREYSERHGIRVLYFYQGNKGPAAARNEGIKKATGQYVAFLDSDDVVLGDSLSRRSQFLDMHPEVDLVFTDYYIQNDDFAETIPYLKKNRFLDNFQETIFVRGNEEIVFNNMFYRKYFKYSPLPIWTGTVMMRRSFIEKIGLFRTDIWIVEDLDYWLRALMGGTIGYIDKPLAIYRRVDSTLTKNIEQYRLQVLKFYKERYSMCDDKIVKKLLQKRLSSAYFEAGYYYTECIKRKEALYYLSRSIFYGPFQKFSYKTIFKLIFLKSKLRNVQS